MVYLIAAYGGAVLGIALFAWMTAGRKRRLTAEVQWLEGLAGSEERAASGAPGADG